MAALLGKPGSALPNAAGLPAAGASLNKLPNPTFIEQLPAMLEVAGGPELVRLYEQRKQGGCMCKEQALQSAMFSRAAN